MSTRWRRALATLARQLRALGHAAHHPDVPLVSRVVAVLVLAYALCPLDLIPDFIPVLGWLDDLVLVPAGLWLAVVLMPRGVWSACLAQADEEPAISVSRPLLAFIALLILLTWGGLLALMGSWLAAWSGVW